MCHGNPNEEAIIRAVKDTKGKHTFPAIMDAATGPPREKRNHREMADRLNGRATNQYGGKVFELLEKAKKLCRQS
jgi:hypothetical protein